MDQHGHGQREIEESVAKRQFSGCRPAEVDGRQCLPALGQRDLVDIDTPHSVGVGMVDEVAQVGADVATDLEQSCRGKSSSVPRPEGPASAARRCIAGHVLIAELAVPQPLEPSCLVDVRHFCTCLESSACHKWSTRLLCRRFRRLVEPDSRPRWANSGTNLADG